MKDTKLYEAQNLIPIVVSGMKSQDEELNDALKNMIENDLVSVGELGINMRVEHDDKRLVYYGDEMIQLKVEEQEGKFYQRLFERWALASFETEGKNAEMEVLFVEPSLDGKEVVDAWFVRIISPIEFNGKANHLTPENRYAANVVTIYAASRVRTGHGILPAARDAVADYLAKK
jgi:hypothetical protein